MDFRTTLKPKKSSFTINHEQEILMYGSCFSQNIGLKLLDHQFRVNINPHGVLFNPLSIAQGLNDVITRKEYTLSDLNKKDDVYFSYHHHSSFSGINDEEVLISINQKIKEAHKKLPYTSTLIITFGTAWVFEKSEDQKVVANCHKVPATNFNKRLLTILEITNEYKELIKKIENISSNIQVLFTVSPVRHIKNGIIEDKRSKSILLESIHQLVEEHDHCSYFPSYEIVMDDLRDYRFYESDMLHPTQQAVDYIWRFFADTHFTEQTILINKQIFSLKKSLAHKSLIKGTKANQEFSRKTIQKVNDFNEANNQLIPIKIN